MARPLVQQCTMCGSALLGGPACTSCGFDNTPVKLAPMMVPSRAKRLAAEDIGVPTVCESRGRSILPADQSPREDNYDEGSEP